MHPPPLGAFPSSALIPQPSYIILKAEKARPQTPDINEQPIARPVRCPEHDMLALRMSHHHHSIWKFKPACLRFVTAFFKHAYIRGARGAHSLNPAPQTL